MPGSEKSDVKRDWENGNSTRIPIKSDQGTEFGEGGGKKDKYTLEADIKTQKEGAKTKPAAEVEKGQGTKWELKYSTPTKGDRFNHSVDGSSSMQEDGFVEKYDLFRV